MTGCDTDGISQGELRAREFPVSQQEGGMAVRPLRWDLVSPALGSVPSCTGICPFLQWDHCPSPVWRQGQGGRGTAGRAKHQPPCPRESSQSHPCAMAEGICHLLSPLSRGQTQLSLSWEGSRLVPGVQGLRTDPRLRLWAQGQSRPHCWW